MSRLCGSAIANMLVIRQLACQEQFFSCSSTGCASAKGPRQMVGAEADHTAHGMNSRLQVFDLSTGRSPEFPRSATCPPPAVPFRTLASSAWQPRFSRATHPVAPGTQKQWRTERTAVRPIAFRPAANVCADADATAWFACDPHGMSPRRYASICSGVLRVASGPIAPLVNAVPVTPNKRRRMSKPSVGASASPSPSTSRSGLMSVR